jgi:hypothetical protein
MANAKVSVLATQFAANAAAIATAAAGGIVTSDITALADLLKTLSLRNDLLLPAMALANIANTQTNLTPG